MSALHDLLPFGKFIDSLLGGDNTSLGKPTTDIDVHVAYSSVENIRNL